MELSLSALQAQPAGVRPRMRDMPSCVFFGGAIPGGNSRQS
jgi:hypothetical protein